MYFINKALKISYQQTKNCNQNPEQIQPNKILLEFSIQRLAMRAGLASTSNTISKSGYFTKKWTDLKQTFFQITDDSLVFFKGCANKVNYL